MNKLFRRLKIYREFIRIGPTFVLNLMLILSTILGGINLSVSLLPFIFSLIALTVAWTFGVIINDYYDVEIDRINYPNRPVVRKALTSFQLKILAIIHIIISLILAGWGGIFTIIYICNIIVILFLYSVPKVRIKKTIFATCVIGGISGIAILIGGSVSSNTNENLYMALWVTVGLSLLGPIKDFKDIEGDRTAGMKTLPVIFGIKKATYIIMGFAIFSVILGIIILQVLLQKIIFASILVIVVGIITIGLLQLHLNRKITPQKAHNITFGLLSLCLLSFFL